jgi:hypothetical protein
MLIILRPARIMPVSETVRVGRVAQSNDVRRLSVLALTSASTSTSPYSPLSARKRVNSLKYGSLPKTSSEIPAVRQLSISGNELHLTIEYQHAVFHVFGHDAHHLAASLQFKVRCSTILLSLIAASARSASNLSSSTAFRRNTSRQLFPLRRSVGPVTDGAFPRPAAIASIAGQMRFEAGYDVAPDVQQQSALRRAGP